MNTNCVTKEWERQGYSLHEPDDHILELRKDGQMIARFSQTGVQIENLLREIEIGKYQN